MPLCVVSYFNFAIFCIVLRPLPGGFSIGGSSQAIGSRPFSGSYQGTTSRHKAGTLQVLSMSAAVTKLRWRPPAGDSFSVEGEEDLDRHDSMLCVATARLSTSGGSGVLSLWSFHRPFMPLSVVEGHEEGAVTDFVWLDTPDFKMKQKKSPYLVQSDVGLSSKKDPPRHAKSQSSGAHDGCYPVGRTSSRESESTQYEQKDKDTLDDKSRASSEIFIWQHVLSVGRDGRCLLQSFARGKRLWLKNSSISGGIF
jgi:WD repeat-containing protein 24